jgi:hypothetical protein
VSEEQHIAPEIYEEILRGTGQKNYARLDERVARKTLVSLVKSGHATFLFLADDETREYWARLAKAAATKVAQRKEKQRLYKIKQDVWNRLSEKDRKILKLRKPIAPK